MATIISGRELRKLSGRKIRPQDGWRPAAVIARSTSVSLRTGETMSSNEEDGRTASIDGRNIEAYGAEFGLKMTVIGPTRGAISLSNSTHFAPMQKSTLRCRDQSS